MVLFGYRLRHKIWASNEYIAERTALSIPTVKRSIKTLCEVGLIVRTTTQEGFTRKRDIKIPEFEHFQAKDQDDPSKDQIDTLPRIKLIPTKDQDDPSIDKLNKQVLINKKATPPPVNILEDLSAPPLIYTRVSEDPDEPRSKYVRMSEAEVVKLRNKIDELDLWPALNSKQALYDLFLSMDVYVSKNPKKNAPENYYRMALNWINREKKGSKKCQTK